MRLSSRREVQERIIQMSAGLPAGMIAASMNGDIRFSACTARGDNAHPNDAGYEAMASCRGGSTGFEPKGRARESYRRGLTKGSATEADARPPPRPFGAGGLQQNVKLFLRQPLDRLPDARSFLLSSTKFRGQIDV